MVLFPVVSMWCGVVGKEKLPAMWLGSWCATSALGGRRRYVRRRIVWLMALPFIVLSAYRRRPRWR